MARRSDREDPLFGIRRLLRGLRGAARAQRGTALRGAVEIALFRLPSRQQAIVRRYDLEGEPAAAIQRDLSLSPRQFFRDRHNGLALLSSFIFEPERTTSAASVRASSETPRDAAIVARTFARSLAQTGDARCLDVLRDLAAGARYPTERADLLLESAQTAADCSAERAAAEAAGEASRLLGESCDARTTLLRGRLARVRARFSRSKDDALSLIAQALTILRASADDSSREPRRRQRRLRVGTGTRRRPRRRGAAALLARSLRASARRIARGDRIDRELRVALSPEGARNFGDACCDRRVRQRTDAGRNRRRDRTAASRRRFGLVVHGLPAGR